MENRSSFITAISENWQTSFPLNNSDGDEMAENIFLGTRWLSCSEIWPWRRVYAKDGAAGTGSRSGDKMVNCKELAGYGVGGWGSEMNSY